MCHQQVCSTSVSSTLLIFGMKGDVMADSRAPATRSAADPLQAQMDAAERLARLVAQDDDQRFILVFHSLINVLDNFIAQPRDRSVDQARSILLRTAEPMVTRGRRGLRAGGGAPALDDASIFADPVFLENAKKMI